MTDHNSSLPPRGREVARTVKPAKKPRGLSWFKAVIILMVIAVVGLGGYAGYLYAKYRDTIGQIGTTEEVVPEEQASERPISMLMLGTDYRAELGSANTDVIMIAALNPNSQSATLVSVPRDTYIEPDGLRANKANSFYSTYLYGNLSSAPKDRDERQIYAMDKIKELYGDYLDIPIDYVTVVDFKTFTDVVDAFDGLTIDVDQNMCHRDYADGTHIQLSAGTQHLDGKQTLDFVRYRKSENCSPRTPESNDFERNARQQQVISKLVEKVKTPQSAFKIGGVFEAVANNVKTDIPSRQIESMIQTYIGIDIDKIEYIHLEGRWDGRYVHIPSEDVEEASAHLQAQLTPEGPSPAAEEPEEPEGEDEGASTST